MSFFDSHYAVWRRGCAEHFRTMSDSDLLLQLAEYVYDESEENDEDDEDKQRDQREDAGWMYGFGHLIAEMKDRKWDISALSTEQPGYKALACMLQNNVLVPLESYASPEYIKKHILEEYEREKSLTPPQKKGIISWLQNHLRKKEGAKRTISIPTITPSFSFLCTRHGTVGKYEKFRKYDIYIINHSNVSYSDLLLGDDECSGEDDIHIGPIKPHSIHHLRTTERKYIRSPYFLDVYEYRGALPTTLIAEIPEEALYARHRKFIKSLYQEGWEIEIKRMEEKS